MKHTTKSTSKTFVYVIHAEGTNRIKIGVSEHPEHRLRELQTGSPFSLLLIAKWPGSRQLEIKLHQTLSEYRIDGEWFLVSPFIGYQIFQVARGESKQKRLISCGPQHVVEKSRAQHGVKSPPYHKLAPTPYGYSIFYRRHVPKGNGKYLSKCGYRGHLTHEEIEVLRRLSPDKQIAEIQKRIDAYLA